VRKREGRGGEGENRREEEVVDSDAQLDTVFEPAVLQFMIVHWLDTGAFAH